MQTWQLDTGETYSENEIEDLLDRICDPEYYEDLDSFTDYLENSEGNVEVYGYEWSAVDILESMGVLNEAIRSYAENEADGARGDIEYDLRHMNNGDTDWFNNYEITCIEINEENEDDDDSEREELQKKLDEERKLEVEAWSVAFGFQVLSNKDPHLIL